MPRKDLSKQRREQILDAFERCIVQFGLEGSSLEKIGTEAGMKRTILRHYIGNREALVHALCARVVQRWEEQLQHLKHKIFTTGDQRKFINFLFQSNNESGESILVAESLIASAEKYPKVGEAMKKYIADYTKVLSNHLKNMHLESSPLHRYQVSYGITAILFNEVSLITLKLPLKFHQAAKSSALRLVDSLSE